MPNIRKRCEAQPQDSSGTQAGSERLSLACESASRLDQWRSTSREGSTRIIEKPLEDLIGRCASGIDQKAFRPDGPDPISALADMNEVCQFFQKMIPSAKLPGLKPSWTAAVSNVRSAQPVLSSVI